MIPRLASSKMMASCAVDAPGGHVARVLLMARRICQNEFAFRRREIAVGDIDGDALLPFGAQAVGEQRKIDFTAAYGLLQLVFISPARIVQQTPD